jgi:scyllo-inositol 2-dehydrogenase (NADP+)
MAMADTVNVGLVGYGLAGRYFHAPFIKLCPGLRLAAILTRAPERQAQARRDFPAARLYTDYEALLADPCVDLIVLAVPHDLHEPMALAAFEAGKHVVTDKIMALDAAGGERMLAAARRAKKLLTVYQNRRWDSDFLTARRTAAAGLLGEMWAVEVYLDTYRAASDAWRWQRARGGGRFRDWGAHLFDQALQFAGPFRAAEVEVWADWQYRYPLVDVETEVVTHLRFPSGLRYLIHISVQQRVERVERIFVGSAGTLVLRGFDPQEAYLRRPDLRVVADTPAAKLPAENVALSSAVPSASETFTIVPGNWLAFWRNLEDVLLRGAELAVKPEEVIESLKLIDRAAAFDPGPPPET